MRKVLLVLILLSLSNSIAWAQNFPEGWYGHWQGDMQVLYANGRSMTINCELIFQPIEVAKDSAARYQWTIIYGEGQSRQERAYELIAQDPETGKYLMDEKNSILLPCFYADETLVSLFEVSENFITSIYRREGDILYFENLSATGKAPQVSGDQNGIPKVTAYPSTGLQRARMRKIKEKE